MAWPLALSALLAVSAPVSPDAGSALGATTADGGHLYTADLSEAELEERWAQEPRSLGSISVGFADMGRLINGVQLEEGEAWTVVAPSAAYGTRELIDATGHFVFHLHHVPGVEVLTFPMSLSVRDRACYHSLT